MENNENNFHFEDLDGQAGKNLIYLIADKIVNHLEYDKLNNTHHFLKIIWNIEVQKGEFSDLFNKLADRPDSYVLMQLTAHIAEWFLTSGLNIDEDQIVIISKRINLLRSQKK